MTGWFSTDDPAIKTLAAELRQLREALAEREAAIARVRAVAAEWSTAPGSGAYSIRIRRALDGPP